MSQTLPLHSAAHRRELWSRADAGVYRGTRDGRPIGEIHRVVGGYVAVDATGTPVGRYASRDDARRALRSMSDEASAGVRRIDKSRVGLTAAGVLGGIALAGALTAAAAAPWL